MGLNDFLTDQAIEAIFNRLEKGPIRIGGIDEKRDLVIWVAPKKELKSSSK